MVAAADPRAAAAAEAILRAGGGAVDAAIAAELVLGLVEPQSSGIGGGAFLMHFDNETNAIVAYDGRERAPMAATPELFLQRNGRPYGFEAYASGLAIGTPSLVAMLKLAHDEHGRLPWADLFAPAIALAEQGFEISPRLGDYLTNERIGERLRADIAARSYFFDSSGAPWPTGHVLRNPTYARTLRAIAEQGPDALRRGPIAEAVVRAARAPPRAGSLALSEFEYDEARPMAPLCGPVRAYQVCGMPPTCSARTGPQSGALRRASLDTKSDSPSDPAGGGARAPRTTASAIGPRRNASGPCSAIARSVRA
jgi:gamma-glutamyltranspeptidase/glutathione hydrolase